MSIPFIDLKKQYQHLGKQIDEGIQNVLDHGSYVMGPEITQLEDNLANFCGAKHAISCSSGTDALLLGLMAYDVGPGDAIFTTPFTFFATAEAIAILGATPVFVDIDPKTFNIDPNELAKTIQDTKNQGQLNPKGIMPVNLFGLCPDFDAINSIATENELFVIEDTAQGFGGEYKGRISGSLGDISATSFFPAKPLGCYGDGGAVFTSDDSLAAKIKSLRVHGQGSNKYDNVRIGLNARMDTIQAAVLLVKLQAFPHEIALRQKVATEYSSALDGLVETPFIPEGYKSVWAQYSVLSENRELIQSALSKADIPSVVYYVTPCHLSTAFKNLGYKKGDMPISESISQRILSLPMHPYVEEGFADQVAKIIKKTIK